MILGPQIDKAANQPKAAGRRLRELRGPARRPTRPGGSAWRTWPRSSGCSTRPSAIYRRTAAEPPSSERTTSPTRPAWPSSSAATAGSRTPSTSARSLWADPADHPRRDGRRLPRDPLQPRHSPRRRADPAASSPGSRRSAPGEPAAAVLHRRLGSLYDRLGDYSRAEDAYRTGDPGQRHRRDRLQQPRLPHTPPESSGQRGTRPDQQRHPGPRGAAGVPRHPRHGPRGRRPGPPGRRRHRDRLASRPLAGQVFPPGPGLSPAWARRRPPAGSSRPASPAGCPAASIPSSCPSTRKSPGSWGSRDVGRG